MFVPTVPSDKLYFMLRFANIKDQLIFHFFKWAKQEIPFALVSEA